MPMINIFSSAPPLEQAARTKLLQRLSALLAEKLGKDERYVMAALEPRADMTFGGSLAPSCYAEFKNVGQLVPYEIEHLSDVLCTELARGLGLPRDRVYIEFTNNDGALWGHDGGTFG